ncbi:MAG: hypothetical protein HYZ29_11510 [Myxococcales bacterium]|nr:hypothetical protein [Myxococcales bacterium]
MPSACRGLALVLSALGVAACAATSASPRLPASLESTRRPAAAAPASPIPGPAAGWAVAYRRECRGSITPPRVAPSGSLFTFCDAAFELVGGRFRENVPIGVLALVDDRRALFDDYSGGGWVLGAFDETERLRAKGGRPEQLALSDDRRRAVSIERSRRGWVVVVRDVDTQRELSRSTLENHAEADRVAFIDDGDPVVLTDRGCRTLSCGRRCQRVECRARGVYRAGVAGLSLLAPRFADVAHVAIASRRALLVRPDRSREIVEVPSGRQVAALPPATEEATAVAIDPAGARIAWLDGGLRVATLDGESLTERHHAPALEPSGLAFSPDGSWLFATEGQAVVVLHQGLLPKVQKATAAPPVPPGFRAPTVRAREQTFSRFDESSEVVWPNQVARFRSDDERVDVWVFATDAAELGREDSLDEWARAAVARYEGPGGSPRMLRSWTDGLRRSVEYAVFVRDGCEPSDQYVRVTRQGDSVMRVVVEVAPGEEHAVVAPLLERFFDRALGASPARREAAHSPPVAPGPC